MLCLLITVMSASGQANGLAEGLAEKNNEDIIKHDEILKDKVRVDLNTLKEKFQGLLTHVNEKLEGLRTYTTDAIKELKDNAETSMKGGDNTLQTNTQTLEKYIQDKINDLNDKMKANFIALSTLSSEQSNLIFDWNEKRSKLHENILSTHVSLCAYDHATYSQEANQPVTYNGVGGGFLDSHKSWQVLGGTKHNGEAKAMEVLNRETGKFKVPENADGLYMFTFSVNMDTAGLNYEPSEYKFEKDGEVVQGTGMYSDAGVPHPETGKRAVHDMVPGSNTILLQLKAGEEVAVRQTKERTLTDYQVSFCGTLIHLEKVGV